MRSARSMGFTRRRLVSGSVRSRSRHKACSRERSAALSPKKRGPKVDVARAEARRIQALERENQRLRTKLGHAGQIIAAQKKL